MVKTICEILRVKGHDPLAAYSGEETLHKAREESFDCVLMDLKMPGMAGVDAVVERLVAIIEETSRAKLGVLLG